MIWMSVKNATPQNEAVDRKFILKSLISITPSKNVPICCRDCSVGYIGSMLVTTNRHKRQKIVVSLYFIVMMILLPTDICPFNFEGSYDLSLVDIKDFLFADVFRPAINEV